MQITPGGSPHCRRAVPPVASPGVEGGEGGRVDGGGTGGGESGWWTGGAGNGLVRDALG